MMRPAGVGGGPALAYRLRVVHRHRNHRAPRPLSCIFAGLSVIIDREQGAQRELLVAPVPRAFLVLGDLAVALGLAALQVVVLLALASLRGAHFNLTASGLAWFAAAAMLFSVFTYAVAEALASRGMSNVTAEAWLSLGVVAVLAAAMTALAIRVLSRSAVGWAVATGPPPRRAGRAGSRLALSPRAGGAGRRCA
jgi:hypothetical protein